ncbi:MAG: hypothetical protein NC407_12195 [Lachnoclostridium sp.]|nr:hypothetical protein [Lachnoclostridium sp.]
MRGQSKQESREGALSLREKRSGTKLKSRVASFSLSAGVFQGPSRDSCLLCQSTVKRWVLYDAGDCHLTNFYGCDMIELFSSS